MVNSIYLIPTPHATKRVEHIQETELGQIAIEGVDENGAPYAYDIDARDYYISHDIAGTDAPDPIQRVEHHDNGEFVFRVYLYYDATLTDAPIEEGWLPTQTAYPAYPYWDSDPQTPIIGAVNQIHISDHDFAEQFKQKAQVAADIFENQYHENWLKFQISDLLSEPFPDTGPNPFKTDTFERRAKARQNITDEWGRASPGFLAMLIWFYQNDLMRYFYGEIGSDFTILNVVDRSHLQELAELVEAELEIGVHNFFDNIPVEDWEQYHNRIDHGGTAPALYTADTSDYTPDKLVWTPANAEQWTKM